MGRRSLRKKDILQCTVAAAERSVLTKFPMRLFSIMARKLAGRLISVITFVSKSSHLLDIRLESLDSDFDVVCPRLHTSGQRTNRQMILPKHCNSRSSAREKILTNRYTYPS